MKLLCISLGLFAMATAFAQMEMNMEMNSAPSGSSKFMQDMNVGMKKMDRDMSSAPINGNVDHDFVTMMIPPHQGAIDMAKGELSYGKDPVMRRLAQEIIADQKSEIDLMNLWLKKHAAAGAKK